MTDLSYFCKNPGHMKQGCIKCIGHLNPKDSKLVTRIKIWDCPILIKWGKYIKGKISRKPFLKESLNNLKILMNLVHKDLCGPM